MPSRGSTSVADQGAALQATLLAPTERKPDAAAEVAVTDAPSPVHVAAYDATATPTPPATAAPSAQSKSAPSPGVGTGDLRIDAAVLADRNRLGDVLSRQMTEFPIEVDSPAGLDGTIRARYPRTALAERREDSVAVWIVVDENGIADEIIVLDGSEDFAEAVVAAVREAHFVPAKNNLKPIRYPISLEFRFVLGAKADAGAVAR